MVKVFLNRISLFFCSVRLPRYLLRLDEPPEELPEPPEEEPDDERDTEEELDERLGVELDERDTEELLVGALWLLREEELL